MNLHLTGKRALVCGSTQGIGRAIAQEFAQAGASVTLVARDEKRLKELCTELPSNSRQEHSVLCADFASPDELKSKISALVRSQNRPFHILVNNSGGPPAGPAFEAKPESYLDAFRHHLVCYQILVQAVVPLMKEARHGRIINIVSTSVREPIQGLGVSNTIRAAVAGWAKTLSKELGAFGITVNNILPGPTNTKRIEELIAIKAKNQERTPQDVKAEMISEIPAGRFAEPQEIAYAALFLASPQAAFINGVSLPVDGGRLSCI